MGFLSSIRDSRNFLTLSLLYIKIIDEASANLLGLLHNENMVREFSDIPKRALKGCDGTVSKTSRESVKLLSSELKYISSHIKKKTGLK